MAQMKENTKAPRHWWPVDSPHKRPVTRKMFPFDDVIMLYKNPFDETKSWFPCLPHERKMFDFLMEIKYHVIKFNYKGIQKFKWK